MMSDFDLIPLDYRKRLSFRRIVRLAGITIGSTLGVALLLQISLTWLREQVEDEVAQLQQKQEISTQQRNRLREVTERQLYLNERLKFLTGLRGGALASNMFGTIDDAMTTRNVWFEYWQFRRAGAVVKKPAEGRKTGYFIVIPKRSSNQESQVWMIKTHMNVKGRALDHSALSTFVRRLFQQPTIDDVRILDTTLAVNGQYVEFNLVIKVSNTTFMEEPVVAATGASS